MGLFFKKDSPVFSSYWVYRTLDPILQSTFMCAQSLVPLKSMSFKDMIKYRLSICLWMDLSTCLDTLWNVQLCFRLRPEVIAQ